VDQLVTFTWTARNVPALQYEPYMPPRAAIESHVKFAPFDWSSWNDISRWYFNNWFQPQLVLDDTIRSLARSLTANATTDPDRVHRLYEYVQKIRYIAIELGQSGYVPHRPFEILGRRYGDCKDHSILLMSLLTAIDIPSVPVLIETRDEGATDPNFPSWQFNHMIVQARPPGSPALWLDAPSRETPFGGLPYDDEGVNVLVIEPDGSSHIELTPACDAPDNEYDHQLAATVGVDGSVGYHADFRFTGHPAEHLRWLYRDESATRQKEFLKGLFTEEFVNATISNVSIEHLDSLGLPFVVHLDLAASGIATMQGDLMMVPLDPLRHGSTDWLTREKRQQPILLPYPDVSRTAIVVQYPSEKFAVRSFPQDAALTQMPYEFTWSMLSDSTSVRLNETMDLRAVRINADAYTGIRTFFEKMRAKQKERLILVRR
jgi:hypothetical protein